MQRIDYSKWDNLEVSDDDDTSHSKPVVSTLDKSSAVTFGGKKWTAHSEKLDKYKKLTTLGGQLNNILFFSQSKECIYLHVLVDKSASGKQFDVSIQPVEEKFDSKMEGMHRVKVLFKLKNIILVEGRLMHPIHIVDEDGDQNWQWSLNPFDNINQVLTITLQKDNMQLPMEIKWRSPFIDMICTDNNNNNSNADEFKKNWDIAHKQFIAKRKEKQNIIEI